MRVGDLMGSRRELLRLGGLGLLGASVDGVWPLRASSTGDKVQPRGNARKVVYFEISGAISHVESFDFKENAGTPTDLDVREVYPGLYLPHPLFPRLEKHMDKIALVRSMRGHEQVHFRAQYYVQTGRQNNFPASPAEPHRGRPRHLIRSGLAPTDSARLGRGCAGAKAVLGDPPLALSRLQPGGHGVRVRRVSFDSTGRQ